MGKVVTCCSCFITITINLILNLLVTLGYGVVVLGVCSLHPLVCRISLSIVAVCCAPYVGHNLVPLLGYVVCLVFVGGIIVLITYVSTITKVFYVHIGSRLGLVIGGCLLIWASWCGVGLVHRGKLLNIVSVFMRGNHYRIGLVMFYIFTFVYVLGELLTNKRGLRNL